MTGPEQGKQLLLFRENLNVSRRGAEGVKGNIDKFKYDKKIEKAPFVQKI